MLKLKKIVKHYKVADTVVEALKGVSIEFRKNEFVAILGPSGCGKTTLLNIIGGLDKYTQGDLVINGKSTKKYKDHDWDVYRNHRIGFIFQSYNLIPHQTILENVELALTISGMGKAERIEKAKKALERVGLADQCYKRPNQLSGGQCQRVAIARALVNEPDILLADEPTGALDTQTSIQIMDLIKEISKEKLVIMVTHNPELADQYANRIIRLLDGEVLSDTNPYESKEEETEYIVTNEKAKMSFWTAFKLSGRNLLSKFKRTFMVGLAGSIGIIGVSLVLALSTGIRNYIDMMQEDMLSGNPITITETTYDLNAMMGQLTNLEQTEIVLKEGIVSVNSILEQLAKRAEEMDSLLVTNEINQDYIDYLNSIPGHLLEEISYNFGVDIDNNIYTDFATFKGEEGKGTALSVIKNVYKSMLKQTDYSEMSALLSTLSHPMSQALSNSEYLLEQYDLKSGKIATEVNEVMIVVSKDRQLSDLTLAQLGYYSQQEFLNTVFKSFAKDKYVESLDKTEFTFEELLGKTFTWYSNDSVFNKKEITFGPNTMIQFGYNPYEEQLTNSLDNKMELKVVGVLQPKENMNYGSLGSGFFYTTKFADYVLEHSKNTQIVDYIKNNNGGKDFQSGKIVNAGIPTNFGIYYQYEYIQDLTDTSQTLITDTGYVGSSSMMSIMGNLMQGMLPGGGTGSGSGSGGSATAQSSTEVYTLSLNQVGGAELPVSISIYPVDFDLKEEVLDYLDAWNNEETITFGDKTLTKEQRSEITYTDTLSIVISMINTMITIVTTALVAFTAISLVVSTVMIGIITYVSVVERIKEIGVIRSLGGRKKDVAHLFNAETFIIGLSAGLLGIGITYLISAIANIIIGNLTNIYTLVHLEIYQAIIMVTISVVLTSISGLFPASSAAKKDPVVALRTE